MPKYYVPFTWEQSGFHVVEAVDADEAEMLADALPMPDPHCEESNNEYACSPADIREATPEEVARAERMSDREALKLCAEALQGLFNVVTNPESTKADMRMIARDRPVAVAVAHARAAGVLP